MNSNVLINNNFYITFTVEVLFNNSYFTSVYYLLIKKNHYISQSNCSNSGQSYIRPCPIGAKWLVNTFFWLYNLFYLNQYSKINILWSYYIFFTFPGNIIKGSHFSQKEKKNLYLSPQTFKLYSGLGETIPRGTSWFGIAVLA